MNISKIYEIFFLNFLSVFVSLFFRWHSMMSACFTLFPFSEKHLDNGFLQSPQHQDKSIHANSVIAPLKDTYVAFQTLPPDSPSLCKHVTTLIDRNISLNMFTYTHALIHTYLLKENLASTCSYSVSVGTLAMNWFPVLESGWRLSCEFHIHAPL